MLIGQYEGRIQEKFQIAFPKRFRDVLGDKLIFTKGLDNCLIVVSEGNWKTLLEGTEGLPFTNQSARDMQRFLLGNAAYVELDSKGRCVLPEHLRLYAGINTDIIYVGIERFVEVWSKKNWDEEQKKLSENISRVAEKLTKKDGDE